MIVVKEVLWSDHKFSPTYYLLGKSEFTFQNYAVQNVVYSEGGDFFIIHFILALQA